MTGDRIQESRAPTTSSGWSVISPSRPRPSRWPGLAGEVPVAGRRPSPDPEPPGRGSGSRRAASRRARSATRGGRTADQPAHPAPARSSSCLRTPTPSAYAADGGQPAAGDLVAAVDELDQRHPDRAGEPAQHLALEGHHADAGPRRGRAPSRRSASCTRSSSGSPAAWKYAACLSSASTPTDRPRGRGLGTDQSHDLLEGRDPVPAVVGGAARPGPRQSAPGR